MYFEVVPFKPQYAKYFRDLNLQWIEKYFDVEPKDNILLEHCKKYIIETGGHIFFAEYNGEIAGCFAFLKVNNTVYELGKMAVDPKYQGIKIGQKLLDFAISFANKEGWNRLILYSSTRLDTALHIYKKYGFEQVPMDSNSQYIRSDIKMELLLRRASQGEEKKFL